MCIICWIFFYAPFFTPVAWTQDSSSCILLLLLGSLFPSAYYEGLEEKERTKVSTAALPLPRLFFFYYERAGISLLTFPHDAPKAVRKKLFFKFFKKIYFQVFLLHSSLPLDFGLTYIAVKLTFSWICQMLIYFTILFKPTFLSNFILAHAKVRVAYIHVSWIHSGYETAAVISGYQTCKYKPHDFCPAVQKKTTVI